jgi:hypothetical protein
MGGRKYHPVAQGLEEQDEDNMTRERAVGKQGLNDYEKALWGWVNVDDLDGFLQEVSYRDHFVSPLSHQLPQHSENSIPIVFPLAHV